MKKKRIVVTQADIDLGERKSYCDCPVARAVKRAFRVRNGRPVSVRHEGIFVGDPTDPQMWFAITPRALDRFITRFDDGKAVAPFEMELEFL